MKQHVPLLREDLWYAVGLLLSIIKDDDYENLGNHATKAMGESGLFNLSQVCNRSLSFLFFNYSYF